MGKHNKLHKRFYKSLFYIVLDSFVEAVHLVDEQDGAAAAALQRGVRAFHCLADVLDAGQHRRQRDEVGVEGAGEDACQRGLADAGRSPQDHGVRHLRLDRHAQWLAGADQVLLADDVVERARAQRFGQRLVGFFGKQVVHALILRANRYLCRADRVVMHTAGMAAGKQC